MIKFTADIDPIPLARPRVNTQTRQAFYPAKSKMFKKELSFIAKGAMKDRPPLTGELKAVVNLYRKFKPDVRQFGDIDNHLKAIFDALNGICFADDSQIVEVDCQKFKGEPKIEIQIEELRK